MWCLMVHLGCRLISLAPPSPTHAGNILTLPELVAASYHQRLLRQQYGFIPLNPFLSNNKPYFQ